MTNLKRNLRLFLIPCSGRYSLYHLARQPVSVTNIVRRRLFVGNDKWGWCKKLVWEVAWRTSLLELRMMTFECELYERCILDGQVRG